MIVVDLELFMDLMFPLTLDKSNRSMLAVVDIFDSIYWVGSVENYMLFSSTASLLIQLYSYKLLKQEFLALSFE